MITIVHDSPSQAGRLLVELRRIDIDAVAVEVDRLERTILSETESQLVLLLNGEWQRMIDCIQPRVSRGFTLVLLPSDARKDVERECHRVGASVVWKFGEGEMREAASLIREVIKRVEGHESDANGGFLETYRWTE